MVQRSLKMSKGSIKSPRDHPKVQPKPKKSQREVQLSSRYLPSTFSQAKSKKSPGNVEKMSIKSRKKSREKVDAKFRVSRRCLVSTFSQEKSKQSRGKVEKMSMKSRKVGKKSSNSFFQLFLGFFSTFVVETSLVTELSRWNSRWLFIGPLDFWLDLWMVLWTFDWTLGLLVWPFDFLAAFFQLLIGPWHQRLSILKTFKKGLSYLLFFFIRLVS